MTLLLAKFVVSIAVVLSLAWVAEHVNSRVAGIVSGMPLGGVLVLFFVGMELGPAFATESTVFAIPSIIGTVAFALGYFLGTFARTRWAPLIGSILGLVGYFAVASVLRKVDFTLLTGIGLTLATLVAVAYSFHSYETNRIQQRVVMTWPRLLFRAGTAGSMVVAITAIAEFVGPEWSGLLIGFPMTFLPFLLIIHITYSAEHVRTIVRNFPLGLIGLLTFLAVANQTIPLYGVNPAILISLAASLVYLSFLALLLNWLRPARASA